MTGAPKPVHCKTSRQMKGEYIFDWMGCLDVLFTVDRSWCFISDDLGLGRGRELKVKPWVLPATLLCGIGVSECNVWHS